MNVEVAEESEPGEERGTLRRDRRRRLTKSQT